MTHETGIFTGMPFSEYRKIPAMNASTLKKISQSPAHARHEQMSPSEPSQALIIGQAFHSLTLEPDVFETEFGLGPDRPKRSKADKEAWAEWSEENPSMIPLKKDDWDMIHGMRDAVMGHKTAQSLMESEGQNEVTMVWNDDETGHPCKARADRITAIGEDAVIVDLKSTVDASPEGFSRSAARFLYHCQAAWYLEGANRLSPRQRRFLFVAVEKTAPYGVTVQELDSDAIEAGAKSNRIWLRRWRTCLESGQFTAYPQGVVKTGIPVWALKDSDKLEDK